MDKKEWNSIEYTGMSGLSKPIASWVRAPSDAEEPRAAKSRNNDNSKMMCFIWIETIKYMMQKGGQ
jgi:hypothetical protein